MEYVALFQFVLQQSPLFLLLAKGLHNVGMLEGGIFLVGTDVEYVLLRHMGTVAPFCTSEVWDVVH